MVSNTLQSKHDLTLWDTRAPIHGKSICCRIALNLFRAEKDSVAEVRVPALVLAVHTPARFATIQLNFEVVLARHGFSEHRTSPEMLVRCAFGGLYPRSRLARDSQGRYPGVSQPEMIRAPLVPPHFPIGVLWPWILLLISWYRFGLETRRLCTLLQHTVIQGGLPPRWPQLSQIAWVGEKHHHFFNARKRRFPATLHYSTVRIIYVNLLDFIMLTKH